jgi:hypothetical protein
MESRLFDIIERSDATTLTGRLVICFACYILNAIGNSEAV